MVGSLGQGRNWRNLMSQKIKKSKTDGLMGGLKEHSVFFELHVFCMASELSSGYRGGEWDFFSLSNGGAYMAPSDQEPLFCKWDGNYFSGKLGADAFGIVCSLFALNVLLWRVKDNDALIDMFHNLRAFAMEHPEATQIFRAID